MIRSNGRDAISRRKMLGGPLLLAACASGGPYLARGVPPKSQRLVYANGVEPVSLDPASLVGSRVDKIVGALLDSLISIHPFTYEPFAALATHYESDRDGTRYTFYLRGNRSPRGTRLPNLDDLPDEYRRARRAPPDKVAALWSDGKPVTAHDFVFAWNRILDPKTGSSVSFYLEPLRSVVAVDDLTFRVELKWPSPWLLKLLWHPFLAALPRHAVGPNWMSPGRYVSSGPFTLREWLPNDRIVLDKNQRYWEASAVELEELVLLPNADGTTALNLYRYGAANSIGRGLVPPTFVPAAVRLKDFRPTPAFRSVWYSLNVNAPPLERLPVRYALSMATDRKAISRFLGEMCRPASGIVPPMPGYPDRERLIVTVDGRKIDILNFNPMAARELLARDDLGGLPITLTFPEVPGSKDIAPIVQAQWRQHLGIEVQLENADEETCNQRLMQHQFRHVIEDSWTAFFADPYDYLLEFGPHHYAGTTWKDESYDAALTSADRILDEEQRMRALFECENRLLMAMPVVPAVFDGWACFDAPYITNLRMNPFGCPLFKYASIDTQWRAPQ